MLFERLTFRAKRIQVTTEIKLSLACQSTGRLSIRCGWSLYLNVYINYTDRHLFLVEASVFLKLNGHVHSIFYYVLLTLLAVFPFVRTYLTNWWNNVYTPWILFQRSETREAVATASLKVFSRHIECPKKLELLCFSLLLQKNVNLCYSVLWKEPKCLRE